VVGNPPWEIRKPSSREFFSRVDPGYRALGKQEAMGRQRQLFDADPGLERRWGRHLANHRALSHFLRHTASPFGDPGAGGVTIALHRDSHRSRALHDRWRGARGELPPRPFRLQGSADINCYKLFVEQSLALVREGGRLGLLLPSGLYTDRGASELRAELLDRCQWKWLFSFDNRDGLFPIHRSTRFGPVIAHKGGKTTAVQVAFQRRDVADWQAENPPALTYPRTLIRQLSPGSGALLELRDERDLAILRTQLESCVPIGGPGSAAVDYHTGMHMTRDSSRFLRRDRAEEDGFRQETYGHWLRGPWRSGGGPGDAADDRLALSVDGRRVLELDRVEEVALPLAQGVGIGLLDGHAAVHTAGSGHRARWTAVPTPAAPLGPQFLVRATDQPSPRGVPGGARVALRSLSNATNERTVIATVLEDGPCGNSLAVLRVGEGGWIEQAAAAAVLASFCFDWAMRQRLAGTNVNAHFLWDSVWPRIDGVRSAALAALTLRLTHPSWRHAGRWLIARADLGAAGEPPPQRLFAQAPAERLRLRCMIDALVAEQYGLDESQLGWILRDCGHPRQLLSSADFRRSLDPKGFWRVDRQLPASTRHTVLTLAAFRELTRVGLEEFAGRDGRGGWQLPGRASDPVTRIDSVEGWSLCADHARRHARIRALAGLPGPA
jgi:hypothetical protein